MLMVMLFSTACTDTTLPTQSALVASSSPSLANSNGFDALGYNRNARIFNGAADGTDGVLDGLLWGDATYANDKLTMKWNSEWDRGNLESWSDLNGYDAWLTNHWNGNVDGGSGESWHYKFKWVGSCTSGSTLADGSQCIWGQFAIVFSQGTYGNQHFWDIHAKGGAVGLGTFD